MRQSEQGFPWKLGLAPSSCDYVASKLEPLIGNDLHGMTVGKGA